MKFTINTVKLNTMLSKASKGVGNSKIMPITEYVEILLQDGKLFITATDLANFITVTATIDGDYEDGRAVVKADVLAKLVAKTTVPAMTFKFNEKEGKVKGNGTYTLALFDGEEFPDYEFVCHEAEKVTMDTSTLKKIFLVNKSAIATEMFMPCLTGYNVGEKAITTDGIKMCINASPAFADTTFATHPVLLTQTLADLLHGLVDDRVQIERDGNKLLFTTNDQIIFGTELDGIDSYPDVTPILLMEYVNTAVVPRQPLLDSIERLSLFVDKFDNNGIKLNFSDSSLTVQDLRGNSSEVINLEKSVVGDDTKEATVNINYLKDLLSVLSADTVEVKYGEGLPLLFTEGTVSLVLSLMNVGEESDEKETE